MKVTLGTQERPYINREREREFIKKREGERERSTNICDISNLFFPISNMNPTFLRLPYGQGGGMYKGWGGHEF